MSLEIDAAERITLDRKSFEALAVESRVRILKSLRERRKTLSELADELKMSVSGVKEHLETLEQVGLIVKMDDGHKWKYYQLTKKGSEIVGPKELKVWILLSLSAIALVGALMALLFVNYGAGGTPSFTSLQSGTDTGAGAIWNTDTNMEASAGHQTLTQEPGAGENERNAETAAPLMAQAQDPSLSGTAASATGATNRNDAQNQKENNYQGNIQQGKEMEKTAQPFLPAPTKSDVLVPLAVAIISSITLLSCAYILWRNRKRVSGYQ